MEHYGQHGASWGFIGTGSENCIDTGGDHQSQFNFIGNGVQNCIYPGSSHSSILNGDQNNLCGNCSTVSGGLQNTIGTNVAGNPFATFSFIGGGSDNWIDATGATATYGVIGGGQTNYIAPGTNHSSIFSGNANRVSGNCSAILGGQNNNIFSSFSTIVGGNGNNIPVGAAFNNVHVIGSGINAAAGFPNSLHINGLWANGIPINPGAPLPVGTVFAQLPGTPPPVWAYPGTTGVLWIA